MEYRNKNRIKWNDFNNSNWGNTLNGANWFSTSAQLKKLQSAELKESIYLNDSINTFIGNDLKVNPIDYSRIQKLISNHLKWADLLDSLGSHNFSNDDLHSLYERYKAVQRRNKKVKKLRKLIKFVRNILISILRDLRETFTVIHSFHFKNLDDYHSFALINAR